MRQVQGVLRMSAVTRKGVEALVAFMDRFEAQHG